jgi:hypothetical protein
MSLRAVEHNFTGATTAIASYDSTKTNLGTLMIQKTGVNPEDNFVGPFPVSVARPMEESVGVAMMFPNVITFSPTIDWVFLTENLATATVARRIFMYEYNKVTAKYNWKGFITATLFSSANANTTRGFSAQRYLHTTGTVAVAAPVSFYSVNIAALAVTGVVTGVTTTFTVGMVGKMIGFGSATPSQITTWYPIISFASTTSITVSGASNAITGVAYVIADCTVTGTSTQFVTEGIAAGTNVLGAAGGLGPRIGFGSTDPTQITQWFQIGAIASDTSLNLVNSPGVIAAGTPYVIEELRFAFSVTQASVPGNGGLFVLKGAGYLDFQTSSVAGPLVFPAIASAVNNQRGVYRLNDNGVGSVTNTAANGCDTEAEISKTSHFLYVLDGTNTTNAKFYKYNLRANNTVAGGVMQLAGANIVVTGTQAVTGTIPNAAVNNCTLATTLHGPGSGLAYLYFVTGTRLYCAPTSAITAGNTTFIGAGTEREEVPPGGVITFPATGALHSIKYVSTIDRFVVTTVSASGGSRQYVTRYPSTNLTPFDHVWGLEDKQQDQSTASSQAAIHFSSGSQVLTSGVSPNGVVHICKGGASTALNQMYALPFGAHWTYGYTTSPANHQRIITPSISTPVCVKFDQLLIVDDNYLGLGTLGLSPEPYRIYYRTADIVTDAISSWTLLGSTRDLYAVPAANAIQFMFEFFTIGNTILPSRIFKAIVTYEDGSTDSHYQLSTSLSNITSEVFAWRFCCMFGKTVPTLKIELFNADTGVLLLTDDSDTPSFGTWQKSIDGGSNWISYNSDDKMNETTYIRYTPTALTDGIMVRALLTQN